MMKFTCLRADLNLALQRVAGLMKENKSTTGQTYCGMKYVDGKLWFMSWHYNSVALSSLEVEDFEYADPALEGSKDYYLLDHSTLKKISSVASKDARFHFYPDPDSFHAFTSGFPNQDSSPLQAIKNQQAIFLGAEHNPEDADNRHLGTYRFPIIANSDMEAPEEWPDLDGEFQEEPAYTIPAASLNEMVKSILWAADEKSKADFPMSWAVLSPCFNGPGVQVFASNGYHGGLATDTSLKVDKNTEPVLIYHKILDSVAKSAPSDEIFQVYQPNKGSSRIKISTDNQIVCYGKAQVKYPDFMPMLKNLGQGTECFTANIKEALDHLRTLDVSSGNSEFRFLLSTDSNDSTELAITAKVALQYGADLSINASSGNLKTQPGENAPGFSHLIQYGTMIKILESLSSEEFLVMTDSKNESFGVRSVQKNGNPMQCLFFLTAKKTV